MIIDNSSILKYLFEADTVETPDQEKVDAPKGFDEDPLGFIINKYETLRSNLKELMGDNFREYITAIFIIADKPTTFKIILHNGQVFYMTYMGNECYECNVAGKRHYLDNIGTKERAMLGIVRLLKYGNPLKTKGAEGTEQGTREEAPAETGEEAPAEETPEAGAEELTESMLLKALLIEADDNDVLKVVNSIKNVAILQPKEVKKIGKTGNNFAVYFGQLNHRDRKARIDAMNQIAAAKGSKFNKEMGGWSSIGYVTVKTPVGEINITAKGVESDTASSTDVKEGLVQSFYYTSWSEPITLDNFKNAVNEVIKGTNAAKSIEASVKREIITYLKGLEANKANVKILNQPLSQALAIKAAYPKAQLIRSGLFTEYRSFANQQFKMFADKWNPGDVYVMLNDAKAAKILQEANKQDNPASKAEILNDAFVEIWGSKDAPLVSVSLKYEKAQGGKAKSYFNKFKAAKSDYNLDDKEINYKEKQYIEGIERLRKLLKSEVKGVENLKYTQKPGALTTNLETLRGKYAALKAMTFFFSQLNKDEYDDGLLALVAFGMSLSDISPAFFKVVANSAGTKAEVEDYPRGSSLALYMEEDKIDPIEIIDSPTSGGLEINLIVSKGGYPYKIILSARNNGMTQGTIELMKITKLK